MRSMKKLIVAVGIAVCGTLSGCISWTDPKALATRDEAYLCGAYGEENRPGVLHGYEDRIVAIRQEIDRRRAVDPTDWPVINARQVRIGMTECAFRAAWGYPDTFNATTTAYGRNIQYVYGQSYVYTNGSRVTAIQN